MTFSVPVDPAPLLTTPRYYYSGGFWFLEMNFDTVMDTTVYPSTGSFEIKKGGVPMMVESCSWQLSTRLKVEFVGDPSGIPLQVKQLIADNYLRSAATGAMVQPWGPLAFTYDT